LIKVFEGIGDNGFRFRLQDAAGNPVVSGYKVRLGSKQVVGTPFHRGDTDNNGQLQLTDAVRILGFLFLGGVAPTCLDAADTDGNNNLQLTDAVRILGFLFLGGVPPVTPGPPPQPCGADNDDAHLGCALYDKC
jgi:hypothetical protein